MKPQSHYTLINCSNLYNVQLQSAGDAYGYSLVMVTIPHVRPRFGEPHHIQSAY